jgi:hypothetical protein
MGALLRVIRELLHEASRDLAPTLIVVVIFQAFFIQHMPDNPAALIGGFAVVLLGLALFVKGLDVAIFPIGETMAYDYARRGSFLWLMLFAFSISFASVAAEPALMAVAYKAEAVSGGSMGALTLRMVAALGVGLAVMVGVWRIVRGHSIAHYLIPGYLIVIISTAFAPPELVGLAFDSGGVVASTVTAPMLAALGVGLAMTISGRNPMLDGFGLIAFGALAPMIIIQIYGILFFVPADQAAIALALPPETPTPPPRRGNIDRLSAHGPQSLADHRRGPLVELCHPAAAAGQPQGPGGRHAAGGPGALHVRRRPASRALPAGRRDDRGPDARRRLPVGALFSMAF